MKKLLVVLSLVAVASTAMAGFTKVNPPLGSEPGLNSVMESLYGVGNFERIPDSVKRLSIDGLWSYDNIDGLGLAQFEAKFSAVGKATFGYFRGADSAKFNALFDVTAFGYADQSKPVTAELKVSDTTDPFRFGVYFGSRRAGKLYSSDAEQNFFDFDHMVTFQITSGDHAGAYVLAWEDARFLGDKDYQDLVVQVNGVKTFISPPSLVPAPAAMALGSLGLGFVGWLRRSRVL